GGSNRPVAEGAGFASWPGAPPFGRGRFFFLPSAPGGAGFSYSRGATRSSSASSPLRSAIPVSSERRCSRRSEEPAVVLQKLEGIGPLLGRIDVHEERGRRGVDDWTHHAVLVAHACHIEGGAVPCAYEAPVPVVHELRQRRVAVPPQHLLHRVRILLERFP